MKQLQEILSRILIERFRDTTKQIPSSIEINDLVKAGLMNEVDRTYRRLGGILNKPPLSFGKWDILLKDFIVELDEEQHFNRNRSVTLNSYIYHLEKGFDILTYNKYCTDYELNCLAKSSWGKYWSSPSTERQFGLPGPKGSLEGPGSPRWKQRAFYDYLRDVFASIYRIDLIRISIYDKLIINGKSRSIGDLLLENSSQGSIEIVTFIEQKLSIL